MTRAIDIKQLIAEEASTPSEKRALEQMASLVEKTFQDDVPYRPEFKAQLRRQLMTQARRQLTPWYRRTAFVGSSVAVAAAALVLVVGMNMWQKQSPEAELPQVAQAPSTTGTNTPEPIAPAEPERISLVSAVKDAQPVFVPDQDLAMVTPPRGASVDVSRGLGLQQLTGRTDMDQFRLMARGLAFRGESRRTAEGYEVSEEGRSLSLLDNGKVVYADENPAASQGAVAIDADAAKTAAYRFLDRARLPIPGQPEVKEETGGFAVVYTEYLEERPVINAQTLVLVTDRGAVVKAEAYVPLGLKLQGSFEALTAAEAIAAATSRGGSFERAELVWVRTEGEETIYLQPYWQVFGTDSGGKAVARYVPALKR